MPSALRKIWTYVPLLLLACAWEAISRSGMVSVYALPPLTTVLMAWWGLLNDPSFYVHVGASLWRGAVGLVLALVVGVALGTSLAWSRAVQASLGPIVQIFYPMPKAALIPLTILWFGIGDASKVFLVFLGCLLPITTSTFNGVRGVRRTLLWSAASLGASSMLQKSEIALMAAVPDLLAGFRTALALAFVLLVASELLMSNEGFGYLIRLYGDSSQYPLMFATSLTVMVLGFTADQMFQRWTARVLRWRP